MPFHGATYSFAEAQTSLSSVLTSTDAVIHTMTTVLQNGASAALKALPTDREVDVEQILTDANAQLKEQIGGGNYDKLVLGIKVIAGLVILKVVYGMCTSLLFIGSGGGSRSNNKTKNAKQQAGSPSSSVPSSGGKSSKKGKKENGDTKDAGGNTREKLAPAAAVVPQRPVLQTCLRSRAPTHTAPVQWRGFPTVGCLAGSPCGNYVVAACRQKRVAYVYPQHKAFIDAIKGTENKLLLDEIPKEAVIARCLFSPEGDYFALIDVVNECIYIFRNSTSLSSAVHDQYKATALVSFVRCWRFHTANCPLFDPTKFSRLVLGGRGDAIFAFEEKTAGCDVFDLSSSVGKKLGGTLRIRAGGSCVWGAASKNFVAASGSFISHLRIMRVDIRGEKDNAELSDVGTVTNMAKLSHVALTQDARRAVLQKRNDTTNTVEIWDLGDIVEAGKSEMPEPALIATLRDADFTEADVMHIHYTNVSSTSNRIDLQVAFVRGGDFVVHQIDDIGPLRSGRNAASRIVCEVHDAHDGHPIHHFAFCSRFGGVATAADDDEVLRLWRCA